jgi:hypothetical protein
MRARDRAIRNSIAVDVKIPTPLTFELFERLRQVLIPERLCISLRQDYFRSIGTIVARRISQHFAQAVAIRAYFVNEIELLRD